MYPLISLLLRPEFVLPIQRLIWHAAAKKARRAKRIIKRITAAKAGDIGLQALAQEAVNEAMTVNVVGPGSIATET